MMSPVPLLEVPWVIGPGRLGLALAGQLATMKDVREPWVGGRSEVAPPGLVSHDVRYFRIGDGPPNSRPTLILVAVPDAAIVSVAERLAAWDLPPVPVLHTSGAISSDVLAPLARRGHPTASLHPLVTVRRGAGVESGIRGAWFGIEGTRQGVEAGEVLVAALAGKAFAIDASAKATYHAASVIASNYVVVLLEVAERLMIQAGVRESVARAALTTLASGAVQNVAATDPVRALTGPVARGDHETVRRHLTGLSAADRALYSLLASEALALARRQGLNPADADTLAQILENP